MVYYANHTIHCNLAGWFQIEGTEESSVKRCAFRSSFVFKPGISDNIVGATITVNPRTTGTFHSLLMCKELFFFSAPLFCAFPPICSPFALMMNNHFIPVYCSL